MAVLRYQRNDVVKGVLNCLFTSVKLHVDSARRNRSYVHASSSHPVKYPDFCLHI